MATTLAYLKDKEKEEDSQLRSVATVEFDGGDIEMNVVGNVLGSANTGTAFASQVYDGAFGREYCCMMEEVDAACAVHRDNIRRYRKLLEMNLTDSGATTSKCACRKSDPSQKHYTATN
jgi:hypothetical protein